MPRRKAGIEIRPRIRVLRGDEILLGPGKADLLASIERTGSIRHAAAELDMSYMRAWTLVKTMNEGFREPLVESTRGGAGRGGAHLTKAGHTVLEIYREMQEESAQAMDHLAKRLKKLMR